MACHELGISTRTFQRWVNPNEPQEDQRPLAVRSEPKNKLSLEERESFLKTVNQPENANRPPSQIIPILQTKVSISLQNQASTESCMRQIRSSTEVEARGPPKEL
ncbi:hypothetical protein [Proteiniclasticum ruminis]|uniref:hypothetical protein n=1 Tax=Proteiniclasticum ruminis TaxID=398199 RepID=UPI0009457515|nr:hypothetical protein [Proteiniclasticum ruminis]